MWVIPLLDLDLPTWMTPAPLRSILPGLERFLRGKIITVLKTSASFLSCFTLILVIRIMNSSRNSMPCSHKMSPTLLKRHIRSILMSFHRQAGHYICIQKTYFSRVWVGIMHWKWVLPLYECTVSRTRWMNDEGAPCRHKCVGKGAGVGGGRCLPSRTEEEWPSNWLNECHNWMKREKEDFRAQELCESRGGRSGLSVPNSPYDPCGHKATLNMKGGFVGIYDPSRTKL